MSTNDTSALTASQPAVAGRVAGAVLAAIRAEVGVTQEGLAESMRISHATVQGWESGRRPLMRLQRTQESKLRRVLLLSGVAQERVSVLEEAVQADLILAELHTPDPEMHPLASVVPNRLLTELLGWPITGRPPRQLAATRARLDIGTAERDALATALRDVADRADLGTAGAMLRRQAQYLVAEHTESSGWLADAASADVRAMRDLREWTPQWPVMRSRAISAAVHGDHDLLHRFIEHGLSSDAAIKANLRYWAYWVGEISVPWSADDDMLTDTQPWSGELLLSTLLDGLQHAPYRDLCAHALHALLPLRRSLTDHHDNRHRLMTAIDHATSLDLLTPDARRKLEQIAYAHRS